MADRRSFLRGLASLPLIGGSVALIGAPCRVVQAATDDQLVRYFCFALNESQAVLRHMQETGTFQDHVFANAMAQHIHLFPSRAEILLRAPVILSAAGVPLTGGHTRG